MREYRVFVQWDDEAKVWVAYSDDIPGLSTEADTFDDLMKRVLAVAPELLELNHEQLNDDAKVVVYEEKREYLLHAA